MLTRRDTTRRTRRDLQSIMLDGAAYSFMVGVGETYVPAFALALGLGEVAAGLIATLPIFVGGIVQLASLRAVGLMGSHRAWVVASAGCQALSLVTLLAMALAPPAWAWLVFVPATVYWGAGLASGPAWNAWVEQLVPRSLRATYFARRTRVSQLCVLVGLIAGGLWLNLGANADRNAMVFALLFAAAAGSRLFSVTMLARQSEDLKQSYLDQNGTSYREVLSRMRGQAGLRLIVYLLLVQVAVHVAAPYFTPYMLRQLELSYSQYMLLLSCGFLGKIVALPWAGQFAKRAGAGRLLWIGGVAIAPLSAMWLVSDALPYLVFQQIIGGMAWGAYELAMLLLFFETIPREHRIGMLTLYNAGNAAAMVIGSVLGAALMHQLADGRTAYLAVFSLSALARVATLAVLPSHPRQPPHVAMPVGMRTLAVRPLDGSVERPIVPAIPDS